MRIMFLYPNARGLNVLPYGIAIFSSLLKDEGHEVSLFDTTYWDTPDDDLIDGEKYKEEHLHVRPYEKPEKEVSLKTTDVYAEFDQAISDFDPDLIAVSCTEDLFPFGIRLLKAVRKKYSVKTIMGGMFATFAPEKAIRYPEIDMLCVGEGEYPLIKLCRRMQNGEAYTHIPGLWIKENGTVHKNPLCKPFDIDSVPLPDLTLFEEARFYKPFDGKVYRTFLAETHRGCPYKCTYCNSPDQMALYRDETGSSFMRLKSIENVRRELLYYKDDYRAEYIYFWADTFLASPEKYLTEISEMYASEIGLPFWMQTRAETITEEKLEMLKRMGIHRMGLGLEHGNEEFRRKVLNRKLGNKETIEKLNMLRDYGIKFSVNNIIGFPMETRELAFDTIELNRAIPADTRNLYTFTPFHGTALRRLAEEKGYLDPETIATSLSNPTILNMPQFPVEEIEGVKRCFVPYVLLEKNRWPEIQKAEKLTPEGNAVWEQLMHECKERFFPNPEANNTPAMEAVETKLC